MSLSPSRFPFARWAPRGRGAARSAVRWLAAPASVLAVAAAVVTGASAAGAATHPQFWVSPTGTPVPPGTSCTSPGFSTVQSAVTAAEAFETANPTSPVPEVLVCPGTYTEQVTITQSLIVTRAPVPASQGPATIQLPSSPANSTSNCQVNDTADGVSAPQTVIEVCAADGTGANTTGTRVTMSHLTVQGNWPNSVCNNGLYDVLVGGGASLALSNTIVEQAGAYPLNGCQGGVGVQVGFAPTSQIGHGTLTGNTIETYQKNGVTVDGSGSTATISSNTVTGAGPTTQIAQNGIQISFGATGTVSHNTVTGNNYTGTGGASASGILVFGGGGSVCGLGPTSPLSKHVKITGNHVSQNDIGVALFNADSTCTKSAPTATDDTVCSNTVSNSHGYPHGVASADANISGFGGGVGYQAGVSDTGNHDVICNNHTSGAGYAPLGSLPNPSPPAFVRPIDVASIAAIAPSVSGNTYDGKAYNPAATAATSHGIASAVRAQSKRGPAA